jgi:hypothetical protein
LPETARSSTFARRLWGLAEHLVLAAVALVPQLLARPGVAVADTKSYLYYDVGRFLRQSASMWDPTVGLGSVTHQQIGYLFPMGPFFWVTHALGVPTWAAQRLWIAAVLFAAGAGVLFLCRTLSLPQPGAGVAALAYMLSPYFLQYVGRISVILLPWAALPWLVALLERGLRASAGGRHPWRHPALFAVLVAAMSSVNASGALYVGVGPVLWLVYAGATRLHRWRDVGAVLWRTALLSAGVSLWWVVGLAMEGGYGIDVLKYTETVPVVSSTALSSEILRGLGYWYFYGGDELGPWVPTLVPFTQQAWLLGVGYGVPLLAVAGGMWTRWRHRLFFVGLALVGMVLAVGAYPFTSPSAVGRVLRSLFTHSVVGLAMRSTDRASPLVLLSLAVLLGAGLAAVGGRSRVALWILAAAAVAVVVAADPAVWNGDTVPTHFSEPGTPPAYVRQAADALNATGAGTRVLAVPGENFAAYRYGDTIDPIWPALLTRPFVTREQQVMGSLAGEDLLFGFDDPMQNGVLDPATVAPVARLLSAGDVLAQNDLAYERYNQPDPSVFWSLLQPTPPGLGAPTGYGTATANVSPDKAVDEQTLAEPPTTTTPPKVAVFPVPSPRPIVRAEPTKGALVVDGDGPGLVDAAGLGLLAGDPPVLYAGTLDTSHATRTATLTGSPTLVVTDTNRKQAFRWNTIQQVNGATLGAAAAQPDDPNNSPLDIFPGAPADAQSTTTLSGVASVTASSYGNPVSYLPEDRAVMALDANLDTAWEVGPYLDPRGQWWQVTLEAPTTAGSVTLVQPQRGDDAQWITGVTLRFDGGRPVRARLGSASRTAQGETISFSPRRFQTLRITITATNLSPRAALGPGASPVGFAEVGVAAAHAEEHVVMPSDLLRAAGAASQADRLAVVMTRQRVAPVPPRSDTEPVIDRQLWLPTTRTFSLTGTARIDTLIPDATIDALVGRPGATGSGVVAYSQGRLPGDLRATASAALDGDPATAWSPGFGAAHQAGQWISVHVPTTVRFDQLDLQLVADGRHSVPTSIRVATENGSHDLALPPVADSRRAGATVSVPVHFPALSGHQITVTFLTVRLVTTHDYYAGGRIALPLGVAELGIPGVTAAPVPAAVPSPCRTDLLTVDGRPVPLRVTGTSAAALDGAGLGVTPCGADAGGLVLGPGTHTIVGSLGHVTGIDLDQLVLDSAPGGIAQGGDAPGTLVAPAPGAAPAVSAVRVGSTSARVHLGPLEGPTWLVLGESVNRGWTATLADGRSLGPPELVDGFANGWRLTPAMVGAQGTVVTLHWAPQREVDLSLVLSLVVGILCLVLALWPWVPWRRLVRRRPRGRHARSTARPGPSETSEGDLALVGTGLVGTEPVATGFGADAPPGALDTEPATPVVVGSDSDGRRPPWPALVVAPLLAGALAAAVAPPWWGVAVVVAVVVASMWRRGRLLTGVAGPGLVVAVLVSVVVLQVRGHYPANGDWPAHMDLAHRLAWGAVLLLAADVVASWLRGRRPDRSR